MTKQQIEAYLEDIKTRQNDKDHEQEKLSTGEDLQSNVR